ncbi:hypothetical protein CSB45_12550 [candidate division KSB3 bacterium]|uniref:Uncharacterized protein n=1 Tax=candidate division KSB3 bacterium TaxID=2044937 RepID=A0A2G6E273_9BACT|nr:MAG: hypothetical protein CSB45_12550 [candidate division KSB3 bacterium]
MPKFLAGTPASAAFEWSQGQHEFCMNIPEAGDYLLTYITLNGEEDRPQSPASPGTPQPHTFAIAFRANAPAYVSIGLEENEILESFLLRRGTIESEAVGLYDDGPIIRYASPSIPTIFWEDVVTLAPGIPPLILEQGDLSCPPPFF